MKRTPDMHATLLSDADNTLLRAWRRGELDDAQAEALEARFFLEPGLAEAARADQLIAEGMPAEPIAAPGGVEPRVHPRPRSVLPLLLAAGFGAAAVLPFALRQADPPAAALANVEWVSLDVRRSSDDAPLQVAPRAGAGLVVLEVPAPTEVNGPFRARIIDESGETALEIAGLLAADARLSLAFAREALAPGRYRIEVARGEGAMTSGVPLLIDYRPAR